MDPSDPMDQDTAEYVRRSIIVVVKADFEQRAKAFGEHPSPDNWELLEDAMWARQALTSKASMDKAVEELWNVGVGYWIPRLRDIHKKP